MEGAESNTTLVLLSREEVQLLRVLARGLL